MMKTTYHLSNAKTILLLVLMMASQSLVFAQPVSRETAQRVATTFLDNNGAKSTELTDVSAKAGFPNLYVYTTDNSFVLVAADSRVQPVLGYSLTSPFDTEDMPDNVKEWLQGYNDEIQGVIDNNRSTSSATIHQWQQLIDGVGGSRSVVVAPMIQTKWTQNEYYNSLCPEATGGPNGHAFTGCVATAMAQIMKYWGYPTHGIGSHSYTWNGQTLSADFGSTTYDWSNMLDYYYYYYDDNGTAHWLAAATEPQITAVATLMYHCGVSVNMNYGGGGSSAFTTSVADALKNYFNYSSSITNQSKSDYTDGVWVSMLKAELDAQRPLQYNGRSSGSGHSFVCDGYDDADYFHFNWGWAGHWDGYFSLNNLDTGANSNDPGAGNGVYTDDQSAVFGIQPTQCAASEPANLTYTQSGIQNITLLWDAATGAVNYNIYRNGNYIGNSATNTYADTSPFGTHVYYVRSVDANGELSLSSNTVTVIVDYQTPMVTDLAASVDGDDVSLTWTAPNWCYPSTPTTTLSYGEGSIYFSWSMTCYGHRYLANDLAQFANKSVYQVATLIQYPGTYSLYVYTKTKSNKPDSGSLAACIEGVPVNLSNSWYEFVLNEPILLTGTDDLWVVIKQANTGQSNPVPSFNLSSYNVNACYCGSSPTSLSGIGTSYPVSWFIRTYLTDGVYTYNLYRDGAVIANQIGDTHYTDSDLADGTYTYYVKTNYYGGETEASNTVTVTLPEPVAVTQTSQLVAGWNWWTPTVQTTVADLEAALNGTGVLINSQDSGFDRFEDGGFIGTLGDDLVPGVMYKLRANAPSTFTLSGLQPTTVTVSIEPGHNWFGFTGETGTIATTLGNFVPADGDQIIAADGSTATYNNGWSGTLTTLTKGVGYLYVSTASQSKTLVF